MKMHLINRQLCKKQSLTELNLNGFKFVASKYPNVG